MATEGMAINWEMAKLMIYGIYWYLIVMEYYYAIRNGEQINILKTWKEQYDSMNSKMSKTKRISYTATSIF